MKVLLSAVLFLTLSLSISCSNGGSSDSKETPNPAAPAPTPGPVAEPGVATAPTTVAGATGIIGDWSSDSLSLNITATTLTLSAQCQNGQKVQAASNITVSATAITVLEDKVATAGECSLTLKKNMVIAYTLTADQLNLGEGNDLVVFTRVRQQMPANPETGGGNAGNQVTFELYAGTNCQGTKSIYTVGMNCAQLTGTVSSLKQTGQQCTNTNQTMNAADICQSVNQQAGGQ